MRVRRSQVKPHDKARPTVEWIDVASRRLIVLGPRETLWTGGGVPDVGGAIVWLQPPPELEREQLDSFEQLVRNANAYAVAFMAARRGKVLLPDEEDGGPPEEDGLALPTIREAVADVLATAKMADEVRGRVTAIIEAALAAEGI